MFRATVTNSPVSEYGKTQIRLLRETLVKDNFLNGTDRDVLVLHSPLLRAKQTAYGVILGDDYEEVSKTQTQAYALSGLGVEFMELPSLKEVNPKEMLLGFLTLKGKKRLDQRIAAL